MNDPGSEPSAARASFLRRPGDDECAPYYRRYIDLVSGGDVVETLAEQIGMTLRALEGVPAGREEFRPREGAWSIREVVGHVIDTERLLVFRALAFARGDPAPLPSMDQDAWARVSNAGSRPLAELIEELAAVRAATVHFFRGLDAEAGARQGVASGLGFTVRSIPWIIAGHELHHRALLGEKYGVTG